MSLTPSTMLPLGTPLPGFELPSPDGCIYRSKDLSGEYGLLVMFISNHCPYVKNMKNELSMFAREYADKGINCVAVNSNDIDAYPDDSPAKMALDIDQYQYVFPYLFDASQDVAKQFKAACTPDFFLFNAAHQLVYRGQFDASRPGNDIAPTGADVRAAADAIIDGKQPTADQVPSVGCNIKWKQGGEPEYF